MVFIGLICGARTSGRYQDLMGLTKDKCLIIHSGGIEVRAVQWTDPGLKSVDRPFRKWPLARCPTPPLSTDQDFCFEMTSVFARVGGSQGTTWGLKRKKIKKEDLVVKLRAVSWKVFAPVFNERKRSIKRMLLGMVCRRRDGRGLF
ncbi:hypothetical protein CDAR_12021 [Caerostris darwini]|uniref:Uncharacterized protein n=1 Tax=Caerostris darwini TaxID=1538125 RepID=A0AAV4M572_9ARAC|nr:hypothetical protein CDAR_12021 [Caerostris darwini]